MRAIILLVLLAVQPLSATAAPLHFRAGQRWTATDARGPAFTNLTVAFGDVNGDGRADMVLYAWLSGIVTVGLSTGSNFSSPAIFAENFPRTSGLGIIQIADVNGDGKGDLVFMPHGADNVPGAANAQVALSSGTKFTLSPQPWNSSWCAEYQECFAVDLNNDKRADLVAFTRRAGPVFTSLSTGGSFGANAIWNNFFCVNVEICAAGDVDGDGRADAIAFKRTAQGVEQGNVLISKSTGTAFAAPQLGHGFFCIISEICLVGDVSGDGKADIVAVKGLGRSDLNMEALVSLSDGNRFINPSPMIWGNMLRITKDNAGFYALADVNGDKRADLIQYGVLPRPANTSEADKLIATVFATSDQPDTGLAPGTPAPATPTYFGWKDVKAYNCAINEERLYFWTIDVQTGERKSVGPVDALYNENVACPDGRDPPTTLSLTAGRTYRIVAVLPSATGCEGRNDPDIVACGYSTLFVLAKADGPSCHFYVGGAAAGCALNATTFKLRRQAGDAQLPAPAIPQTADGLLSALTTANVDYSRPDVAELRGWLGNPMYTPYPAISQALLGLVGAKQFLAPVYIDVIAFKYEPNQNATRPRTVAEVDIARLKAAVLAASNERHGTRQTDFAQLLTP
ncbi:FG-GAP repeat domain-containing protein [Sphingomonas crocodyli]|uniref:VCBS repeat-containing protein n=1 Tax=Sphingomonas crocodyli TaxID=1979270 RepID=A0A437LXZ6_9SPHN|nr:VCBS repeat-containing protein [Sphingomonas crocodyli]RVT90252.1 VCBS repeat-containing protein [Sphingomonas crocodyli]